MTVTPSALPIWNRSVSFTEFGGHLDKQNRLGVTTHNPKTDFTAEQFSSMVDYLARISWVVPFAVISFSYSGTTVTIHNYLGLNGTTVNSAPTATVSGTSCIFAFEDSYSDSYSVSNDISLLMGIISPQGPVNIIPYTTITNTFTITAEDVKEEIVYNLMVW